MPAISRKGDSLSTGHICVGTTTLGGTNTDNTVWASGAEVAVIGAPTVSHAFPPDPPCTPHIASLNDGSPNVFVNGIGVGRIDDSADAGAMTSGSGTVIVN